MKTKKRKFILIIAGSREFKDYKLLTKEVDRLIATKCIGREMEICSGMAPGADLLGARYARENELTLHKFYANWEDFPGAAGMMRNAEMGTFANGLIAFWNGNSAGTRHMIEYMRHKKKPTRVIRFQRES